MRSWLGAPKDFAAGLLFLIIGLGAAYVAQGYAFGEARRMGPAYFPTYAGLLLAFLGTIIALRGVFGRGPRLERFAIKPALIVLASVVAFAALIKPAGLGIACIALVLLSSLGSARTQLVPTLISAIVLTAFSGAVFTYGLELSLPLLGTWFDR
jgi:hypothetical protein